MTRDSILGSTIRYVDTHCHVDLFPDPDGTMRVAREQGIALIAMTNAPSVFTRICELAHRYDNVFCALGLHPELMTERHGELPLFKRLVGQTRFVGEIGLDGTRGGDHLDRQSQALRELLTSCQETGRHLLSVHSRRAGAQILEAIDPAFEGTVILHWFSGTLKQAHEALARGWYFSVNRAMTASRTGQQLIKVLPKDRVLTESDAPLALVGGRPSSPHDVVAVVEFLADCWHIEKKDAARQILETFVRAVPDQL